MAVLSREEIRGRLSKPVAEPTSLAITPLIDLDGTLDVDSIDLRLGTHFLLPRMTHDPFYCPDATSSFRLHARVHVPLGRYLVVPAHQTVLGATLEYVKMPQDVSGQILTKSSVARTFIVIETAPWIHPGYRGCLTLEIANVSNTPVLLYPGRPIAQLILLAVAGKFEPAKLELKYLGPTGPAAPVFCSPQKDLAKIGIKECWVIPDPERKRSA